MEMYKRTLPVALAIAFGLLTLLGLLFVPAVGNTLVSWAAFLAAVLFAFGLYFANLAYKIILETGTDSALFMARIAKLLAVCLCCAIARGGAMGYAAAFAAALGAHVD